MTKVKRTFGKKVKDFLKEGNERKLNKFSASVVETYEDAIVLLEIENKKLVKEIEFAKDNKVDFIFNINLNRINSMDERAEYVEEYAQNLLNFDKDHIWENKFKLEDNNKKIVVLKELIDFIKETEPIIETQED